MLEYREGKKRGGGGGGGVVWYSPSEGDLSGKRSWDETVGDVQAFDLRRLCTRVMPTIT